MSYLHLSNHLQLSCPTRLHCIFDPVVKRTWIPTTGSPMSDKWHLGRTCFIRWTRSQQSPPELCVRTSWGASKIFLIQLWCPITSRWFNVISSKGLWYDTIWYNMIWYNTIRYDAIQYDTNDAIWYIFERLETKNPVNLSIHFRYWSSKLAIF